MTDSPNGRGRVRGRGRSGRGGFHCDENFERKRINDEKIKKNDIDEYININKNRFNIDSHVNGGEYKRHYKSEKTRDDDESIKHYRNKNRDKKDDYGRPAKAFQVDRKKDFNHCSYRSKKTFSREGLEKKYGSQDSMLNSLMNQYGGSLELNAAANILSFIIQNRNIIEDYESEYLSHFINENSDIVTILKALVNYITNDIDEETSTGFDRSIKREMFGDVGSLKGYLERIGYENFVQTAVNGMSPQFLESHTFTYVNVYNAHSTPFYILKQGDSNLIQIDYRPGFLGLSIPHKCIVFHTTSDRRINFGSLIHAIPCEGIRCTFVERSLSLASPFTVPLIEAYMGNSSGMITMQRNTDFGDYKAGPPISVKAGTEHSYISFNSRSDKETKEIVDVIDKIEKIMPYVPRSVLVGNTNPQCVVELYSKNVFKTDSQMHFFSPGSAAPPRAYHINKNTINAVLSNFATELNSIIPQVRFAITGQSMSYAIGEIHEEKRLDIPTCDPSIKTVFEKGRGSHMVLLVDDGLATIPNERPMEWDNHSDQTKVNQEVEETVLDRDIIQIKKHGYYIVAVMVKTAPYSASNLRTFPSLKNMIDYEINNFIVSSELRFKDSKEENLKPPFIETSKLASQAKRANIQDVYNTKKYYIITTKEGDPSCIKDAIKSLIKRTPVSIHTEELFDVNVQHLKSMTELDANKFVQTVRNVCNRCGWLSKSNFIYKEIDDRAPPIVREKVLGFVTVRIANKNLATTFALEVQKILKLQIRRISKHSDEIPVNIPQNIVPLALLDFDDIVNVLQKWFIEKGLPVKFKNHHFVAPNETEAKRTVDELLKTSSTLHLPRSAIKVDSSVNLNRLQIAIKSSRLRSFLSNKYRCVIAPIEEAEAVRKIIDSMARETEEDLLDMDLCDGEEDRSSEAINVFSSDGKIVNRHHFCLACTKTMLVEATKSFYSELHGIDFVRLMENITTPVDFGFSNYFARPDSFFPETPLGALLYSMCCEPSISSHVKAWVNARVMSTIRSNPHLVTFCPDHPMQLLQVPARGPCQCREPGCRRELCMLCGGWHESAKCDKFAGLGVVPCPYCHFPVEKSSGCNHISCRCGKHWCYKCGKAWFDTSQECYAHMSREHGGCFDY